MNPTPELTSVAPERSKRWARAVLLILLLATFLNYANRFAFTQNSVPIQKAFETDKEGYGIVAGKFAMGFACGGLLFGILADWISVRWLYPFLVIAWSAAGFSSGLATSLDELGVSRFLLGLFEAGHWACALRTTQRVFKPHQRTWGNSVLQSGASLGAVATPLLVVALYHWNPSNWRWTFLIVGSLGIPWAIWWWLTVSEADVRRPVIQTDEASRGKGKERELQEISFFRIFITRRWWLLLFTVICINTVWHYIRVWMPTTLEKVHGYTHVFVQYFTALYYLATFFGSLASGWLTGWLARRGSNVHRARMTTFLVFTLLASFAIPAAFLPAGNLMLGCLLVVAFGSLGLFPIYYSLNQEISAKNQGKVGGSLGFSTWTLLSFVHPAVGRLVQDDPSIRPYLFAGVAIGPMLAFAALALFWGKRPTEKGPDPQRERN